MTASQLSGEGVQAPSEVRDSVSRLLEPVLEQFGSWRARHAVLPDEGSVPAAIISILQDPEALPMILGTRVAMAAWVVATDDLFDKRGTAALEVRSIADECCQCVQARESVVPTNPYSAALLDFENELSQSSFWEILWPVWSQLFVLLIRGFLYEFNLGARLRERPHSTRLPSLNRYLRFARHSISSPWLLVSSLASSSDLSLISALARLVALSQACGVVERLANDLATYRREEAEFSVNAIALTRALLLRTETISDEVEATSFAENIVRARLTTELELVRRKARGISTRSGLEQGFLRHAEAAVRFYEHRDVRDWIAPSGGLFQGTPHLPAVNS